MLHENGHLTTIIAAVVILIEAVLTSRKALNDSKLKDIFANIKVGVLFGSASFILKGVTIALLSLLTGFGATQVEFAWYDWIVVFLLIDFVHYAIHYLEHRVRIFWALHSVHHSSEQYNFSVAVRGPLGAAIYRIIYITPLCLLGYNIHMVIAVDQIIIMYGFFLHTEHIGKLGWLEYFMNTPSHHRVHHSSNEECIDKNFGICLIVWDKLFRTFIEEKGKLSYGLTTPVKTNNPFRIIGHEWVLLIHDLKTNRGLWNWMNTILNRPGWKPESNHPTTPDLLKQFRRAAPSPSTHPASGNLSNP